MAKPKKHKKEKQPHKKHMLQWQVHTLSNDSQDKGPPAEDITGNLRKSPFRSLSSTTDSNTSSPNLNNQEYADNTDRIKRKVKVQVHMEAMQKELEQLRAQAVEDRQTIGLLQHDIDCLVDNIYGLEEIETQLSNEVEDARDQTREIAQELASKTRSHDRISLELGFKIQSAGITKFELEQAQDEMKKHADELTSKTNAYDRISSELDLKIETEGTISVELATAIESQGKTGLELASKIKAYDRISSELALKIESEGKTNLELATSIESHNKIRLDMATKTESHSRISLELCVSKDKLHLVGFLLGHMSASRLNALNLAHPESVEKRNSRLKRNHAVHYASVITDLCLLGLEARGMTSQIIISNYGMNPAIYLDKIGDSSFKLYT